MKKLAQSSNDQYEEFNEARFRPLIGIDIVRNIIQDMWVKVGIKKKMMMSYRRPTFLCFIFIMLYIINFSAMVNKTDQS
jgi:hypothetical protein